MQGGGKLGLGGEEDFLAGDLAAAGALGGFSNLLPVALDPGVVPARCRILIQAFSYLGKRRRDFRLCGCAEIL